MIFCWCFKLFSCNPTYQRHIQCLDPWFKELCIWGRIGRRIQFMFQQICIQPQLPLKKKDQDKGTESDRSGSLPLVNIEHTWIQNSVSEELFVYLSAPVPTASATTTSQPATTTQPIDTKSQLGNCVRLKGLFFLVYAKYKTEKDFSLANEPLRILRRNQLTPNYTSFLILSFLFFILLVASYLSEKWFRVPQFACRT